MFLLLFLFWIILNGRVTIEIVAIGAAVSAVLTFAAHRILGNAPRKEVLFWRRLPGIFMYLLYLVYSIIVSNLQVIRVILSGDNRRPKLVWFDPKTKGDTAKIALANSITLTPGTVTVAMGEDTMCVYALRPEMAEDIDETGIVKRLRRLEDDSNA